MRALICGAVMLLAAPAFAQITTVTPTPGGGYMVNGGGSITTVRPTPNGGYMATGPGRISTATPTPNGGYVIMQQGGAPRSPMAAMS